MADRVISHQPIDLHGVKDDGIKSLVLLAASLGYKYDWRSGKPILLFAADQTQISLSSETSINAGVFQGKLNHIMTHYDAYHYTPTIELIDSIIKQCKPNKDQQRLLRLAVGETMEETRKRMRAQEAGPATEKRHPDEHLTQRIEVPTEVIEPQVGELVVEPPKSELNTWVTDLPGVVLKPHLVYFGTVGKTTARYFYESEVVLDRVWPDGHVDYICRYCHEQGRPDYAVKLPSGIGYHRNQHIEAGEVEKIGNRTPNIQRNDGVEIQHHAVKHTRRTKKQMAGTAAHRESALDAARAQIEAAEAAELAELAALDEMDKILEERHEVANASTESEPVIVVRGDPELLTDEQKIWAIRDIIDDGQVGKLQEENIRLATRVASLESDLRALKDLIGGIK